MEKLIKLKTKTYFPKWDSIGLKRFMRIVLFAVFCFALGINNVEAADLYSNNENLNDVKTQGNVQQIEISGTVSDADGPLPGATVLVKGTSNGTTTDFDGNYTITVENSEAILVFSFIGFKSQEIAVGNRTTIDVILAQDTQLDEVVVIGYTTRKKGELTGSVSTIKSDDLERSTSKDVAKSLAGRASGLIINDRGGYPGAGNGAGANTDDDATTILIRGKSTLGNNSPLILIDGIQTGSFSQLAPQDIASLTILKDGAAAIYGSRAANGVILITTKRGKSGKPKINLSSSYSVSSFSSQPDIFSSEQYAIYQNEIADRNGISPLPFTQEQINNYASGTDPINFPSTNWSDLTFADNSPELRNSLSISGGNENVSYFVSADAISQEGVFRSGDLKFRQNQVRSNVDIKIIDDLKIGVDLSGRFGVREEPGVDATNIYKTIYTNLPTEVGIYPNGLPGRGGDEGNPYITSSNASGFTKAVPTDLRGKFSYDLNLSKLVNGLSVKGYAGIRKMNTDTKSWYTPWTYYDFLESTNEYVPQIGSNQRGTERILRETFWKYDELLLNTTVHYSTSIGDDHNISAFAGLERLESDTRTFWAEKSGFPTDDHSELFAGSDEGQQSFGTSSEGARMDFFGSFSYNYNQKYFIDITIRHDGSSNFGPGKRYGTFPSVAASWALHQESFMDNVNWLNSLKLRASWSKMGNDRIAPNLWQYVYNFGSNNPNTALANFYIFGTNGTSFNGFTSGVDPNPDVTWETAFMKNIGLSFTLFDSRLSADINYFHQNREDILVDRGASTPDFLGLNLPPENIGEVKNYGLEFELSWVDKVSEDLTYNLGMNFTQAKNEVVFLDEAANVTDALRREGRPLDSYIVYPTDGIFQDQTQVDATAVTIPGTTEGEPNYLDTNGDGTIDAGDRIRLGASNIPEIQYGVYGGLNYKNFDLSFLFQGQAKAKTLVFFDQSGGKPVHVFNERWTPDNRNARYPRAFQQGDQYSSNQSGNAENFEGADFWLRDASFLRLKEVELGYTLSKDKIKIGDLKIFARGFNLLTMFSDIYDLGLDPEATGYNNFRGTTYSQLKTYSVGMNFSF